MTSAEAFASVRVLARHEMPIATEDDVVVVRKRVRALAQARGFDGFAAAAITTATSELVRNALTHGGGGSACIEEVTDGSRAGLIVSVRDDGPGIAELDRALAGGFSTAKSLGLGLSGSKKLVDAFEIDTAPGRGTRVKLLKWTRY